MSLDLKKGWHTGMVDIDSGFKAFSVDVLISLGSCGRCAMKLKSGESQQIYISKSTV